MKSKFPNKLFLILVACCFFTRTISAQVNTQLIPTPKVLKTSSKMSDIQSLNFSKVVRNQLSEYMNWVDSWVMPKGDSENLRLERMENLEKAEYTLKIKKVIEIGYADREGLANALSTLNQLWIINDGHFPEVEIIDQPKFGYRGMHLDVSRHYFSISEIKKYINQLSLYKMNKFHWHLTDDQGWRIEIKRYPKIQEIAAYRPETLIGHYNDNPQKYDGKRYGGYYSQAEIKEVINYAQARGIEVIPEIDIPGHSSALIAAYPELSCHGRQIESATKWGVFSDILCPTEYTFEFLENIFTEIAELFPSKYIHIGGDECPKDQWKSSEFCQSLIKEKGLKDEFELQSYFIRRVERFLNSKGKSIIGWDEILEGGLAPNATVMSWRGVKGGVEAAHEKHDVIMTPTSHCYFDYYQSVTEDEPLAIGGFIPIEKVYHWSPIPEALGEEFHQYILGGQANVWTEYMPEFIDVEYMAYARMMTLSEVLWGRNVPSLEAHAEILLSHLARLDNEGVNVANHLLDLEPVFSVDKIEGVRVIPHGLLDSLNIFKQGPEDDRFVELKANEGLPLNRAGLYKFKATTKEQYGSEMQFEFMPHKGNYASLTLEHHPSDKYSGNGASSLINGIEGYNDRYGGTEWLGFAGTDFIGHLEFTDVIEIDSVEFKFFKGEGQWIYLPKEVIVYAINDGVETELVRSTAINAEDKICKLVFPINVQSSKLKIVARNFGEIPEGKQGAGNSSWLFIDEIVIH